MLRRIAVRCFSLRTFSRCREKVAIDEPLAPCLNRNDSHDMSEYPSARRARSLRQQANTPEQKAWETLRQLRAEGYAVRRQVAIEGLTVDFAIRSLRLVIEIDGAIHDLEAVRQNDAERDAKLRTAGWQVLRVPAKTAMSADHIIGLVRDAISKRRTG